MKKLERGGAMASIREVAKLAGVSPATVSRVMNGTARVDPEKMERVQQAIEETGFVPNEVARSLFKKSAKMIGLIIPSIRNPFFTQMASYIDEAAHKRGYRVFLCEVGSGDLDREKAALQMLSSMNADGVILASTNDDIQPFVEQYRLPVVALDARVGAENANAYICCDDYMGGRMAAEYLLERGCKNMVCIKGSQTIQSARARYEGYRDVCRERNLPEQTVECDYDFDMGLAMTEQLLHTYPDVDGIIACNDIVAISTYKILHKRKIAVPEQVQLIGFDNIHLASLMSPELTTIRQPIREMADKAVELMIDKTNNEKKGERFVFPVTVCERETTKQGIGT